MPVYSLGYNGTLCDKKIISKRSTIVTTPPTTKLPTIPTTTTTVATTTATNYCTSARFDCSGHYNCGVNHIKECIPGYMGANCNEIIPNGVADCDVFECKLLFVLKFDI